MLRGRAAECAELEDLLKAVLAGESRSLAVLGEPGVGKTALLNHFVAKADGVRVHRITGVQSEMELAFSGLHQMCAPMSDRIDRLPAAQRGALRAALGLGSGEAPDPFLVGLATLTLLAGIAEDGPLVCVVDDAQWLDRASMQALTFAARRLLADSVAMIFAARIPSEAPELAGLPVLIVGGLHNEDARALLLSALPGRWDERVLDRLVAETRGNPLALLELPKDSTAAELAGGFGLPGARALTGRIQETFQRRIERLAPLTRQLLLVAAAEPSGQPTLLWRAADQLGIGLDAATPALSAGLLHIDEQVRFHHPLVRSAVYWAATDDERRSAHRALAEVTDPQTDPDRRAWHAAQAASGPSEQVASELERSAGRAQARGGAAAAAALLSRAVELTADFGRRPPRALAAARATHDAGTPGEALRLLSIAETGPLDERCHGEVELLRAQIAFTMGRGSDAALLLLGAARHIGTHNVPFARDTYLDAINAAMFATPTAAGDGQLAAAQAARCAPPAIEPARPSDLLLDGMIPLIIDGHSAGVPVVQRALHAFRGPDLPPEDGLRWLWLVTIMAASLWDYDSCHLLSERHVRMARDTGRPTTLPLALTSRIATHVVAGELAEAAALIDEVQALSHASGISYPPYGALLIACWQGDEAECERLMKTAVAETTRRGEGGPRAVGGWAMALLHNSLGRYTEALADLTPAVDHGQHDVGTVGVWALAEYLEAATRSGRNERVGEVFRKLTERTGPSGTDWALGVEARCRALLTDGPQAEAHYDEAIERLDRTAIRGEAARAHLLYGEWLRRRRRQRDARQHLRSAHESFLTMGMRGFAQRAERELEATGAEVRRRAEPATARLTAQETQIVRLVIEGLTNPEIAARMFISPRTVEWHLRNIFGKLGVTGRRQLVAAQQAG